MDILRRSAARKGRTVHGGCFVAAGVSVGEEYHRIFPPESEVSALRSTALFHVVGANGGALL